MAAGRGRARAGRSRLARLGVAGALALSVAAATSMVAPMPAGASTAHVISVVGNHLERDGAPFDPRGMVSIALLGDLGCASNETHDAKRALTSTLAAIAGEWKGNTVRLHVSQYVLAGSDPAVSVADYLTAIQAAVAQAHADGLSVILSMQDESLACEPAATRDTLPTAHTVAAWDALVPAIKSDKDVMLQLFNEPQTSDDTGDDPTAADWTQWRDGGGTQTDGDAVVGFQALVDEIRGLQATNVLIADGLNKSGKLQGLTPLADSLDAVAYSVHPYYYTKGPADWQERFGYLAASHPVIATAWNYSVAECGTKYEMLAPSFLSYLADRDIGVMGQVGDDIKQALLVTDLTTYGPTACSDDAGRGPGLDFLAYLTDTSTPRASALTATAAPTQVRIGSPVTVSGRLTVQGEDGLDLLPLTVTRDGVALPGAVTVADGAFSFSDVPPSVGDVTYEVSSAATQVTAAAAATVSVSVVPPPSYTALAPQRICDTRGHPWTASPSTCSGPGTGSRLKAGQAITVDLPSGLVPAGASAVVLNVTAVGAAGSGYLTVYPAGAPVPLASSVNYAGRAPVPNLVEVAPGTGGAVRVYSSQAADVVVDLEGYEAVPAAATGAGLYRPAGPVRICDTRAAHAGTVDQCTLRQLHPGQPLAVTVAGEPGLPTTGVAAVVLNVTAVAGGSGGYVTVYPASGAAAVPTASNVNFSPARDRAQSRHRAGGGGRHGRPRVQRLGRRAGGRHRLLHRCRRYGIGLLRHHPDPDL